MHRIVFTLLLALALVAPASATVGSAAERDAARLLLQATFGPTPAELQRAVAMGTPAWVEDQFSKPATSHQARLQAHYDAIKPGLPGESACVQSFLCRIARRDTWWDVSIYGEDQLRQRVAFALSQMFVVSDLNSDVAYTQLAPANFYDVLAQEAFGNYRTLLERTTLHPAMGRYLGMLQNEKANPAQNTEPDENFAREVMQLFSIGLVQLNADGTPMLDAGGNTIPTYDNDDITAFARVFTGWNFGNAPRWNVGNGGVGIAGYLTPMAPNEAYHDTAPKTLLDVVNLPGAAATPELAAALDTLFAHPNTGPFLARHLIQRLVTANPSPAYVGRVAAKFANNGSGVRGDLKAVVRQVLLDPEARDPAIANGETYGKPREPLLRMTALWRAFDARGAVAALPAGPSAPIIRLHPTDTLFSQAAMSSPSVFNFYRPNFSPTGELRERGLYAPEFQILNEGTALNAVNVMHGYTYRADRSQSGAVPVLNDVRAQTAGVSLDLGPLRALSANPPALVDELARRLLAGRMDPLMRAALEDAIAALPLDDGGQARAEDAVFLVVSSPQFAIQR